MVPLASTRLASRWRTPHPSDSVCETEAGEYAEGVKLFGGGVGKHLFVAPSYTP